MVSDERRALLVPRFFRDCFRTKTPVLFRLKIEFSEVLRGQAYKGVVLASGTPKPCSFD